MNSGLQISRQKWQRGYETARGITRLCFLCLLSFVPFVVLVAINSLPNRLQLSHGIVHGIGNIDVAGGIDGDALWECELGLSSGAAVSVVAFDPGASDR